MSFHADVTVYDSAGQGNPRASQSGCSQPQDGTVLTTALKASRTSLTGATGKCSPFKNASRRRVDAPVDIPSSTVDLFILLLTLYKTLAAEAASSPAQVLQPVTASSFLSHLYVMYLERCLKHDAMLSLYIVVILIVKFTFL